MLSNSGPNGEPLACGYEPHGPASAHSWATLPTWTQSPDGGHCAHIYDQRDPLRSRCWRTREQHAASDYSHDFVAPPPPPGGGGAREAATLNCHFGEGGWCTVHGPGCLATAAVLRMRVEQGLGCHSDPSDDTGLPPYCGEHDDEMPCTEVRNVIAAITGRALLSEGGEGRG